MKQKPTNEEFVVELMNYSPYGGLVQAFIICGIESYCNDVIKNAEHIPISGLVSREVWIGIAKDIKAKLDMNYG